MTGLNNIIGEIDTDASSAAEQKIADAEKKAQEILSDAKSECDRIKKEADDKEKAAEQGREERLASSIDLAKRTSVLKAKQELIAAVIQKAYEKVQSEDTEAYFVLMEKLIRKFAQPSSGEAYFSRTDLERMPADFESRMHQAAQDMGGSLQLMRAGKNIPDGFILVYGDIEENCTLDALFSADTDEMQDKVQKVLFG